MRLFSGGLVFILIARLFSVADFGIISFAVGLNAIINVIAGFGFDAMALRDIPQKRYEQDAYVFNAFLQKLAFSLIAILAAFVYLTLLYEGDNYTVGLIFSAFAIVTSFQLYLTSVFKANNQYQFDALTAGLYAVSICAILLVHLFIPQTVVQLAWGFLAARLFLLLISLVIYYKTVAKSFYHKIQKEIQAYYWKEGWSFGSMAILGTIYFTVDSQFLAYYSGNEILGQYQTVARLVFFTLILTELASQVFLPALAARYRFEGLEHIKADARHLTKYLWIVGLASMIFCNVFGKDLISFIFGPEYLPGLAVMLLVTSIMHIRVALTVHAILLTITDHQRTRVLIVAVTLMVALLSNAFLIPKYGMMGAGWAGLLTHLVLFSLYVFYTTRIANDNFLRFSDVIKLGIALLAIYLLTTYFEASLLIRMVGFVMVSLMLLFDLKLSELKALFQR